MSKNLKVTKKQVQKWAHSNRFQKKGELVQITLVKEEMQKLLDRALSGYSTQASGFIPKYTPTHHPDCRYDLGIPCHCKF